MSNKYAIVNIYGRQYKVCEGDKIRSAFNNQDVGASVSFSDVYLLSDQGAIKVGQPTLTGGVVKAKVAEHVRDAKVLVFKYLRKNKSKKLRGHRQPYTVLEIQSIEG